jgi:hypothetical protein
MPSFLIATLGGGFQRQVAGSMQRLLLVSTDARPAYAHKVVYAHKMVVLC